jgi:replicative DNA helicase
VSRLRQWIKSDKLDAVFIDGITYLSDERYKRGDSKTISLTNISEDLMELSGELHVPIVVVVQANRGGVVDKNSLDTPELENIRDSDGIAQNASIVYAIRQVKLKSGETFLMFDNKKMRGGEVGKSYKYRWDINYGTFEAVEEKDINLDKPDDEPVREKKEVTGGRRKKRDEVAEDDY